MKLKSTLITFLLVLTLLGCKQQNSFSDYQYADKPDVITCSNLNSKLYNEALYSFEDDIFKYYKAQNFKSTLTNAYSQFIRTAVYGRLKYEDVISKHTLDVFEALKNENDLWDANNKKSHLNYKSSALNCVGNNIKDENLKTTFNALISTNSMSPELFGSPLMPKFRNALSDKHLALYIALDLYYSNLFDIDLSKVNLEKPEQKVDFNKVPPKTEADTHAGHNH
ncbi:hypothetical protein [uncultured Algibacter sp.]|uniref:hypothetical protein n=1 Tax=uncultured Algibacter sp. TaxID=298659 RepID=UPI002617B3AA|nr:hypothetical protein [uncultured Algibacter sp.]